MNTDHTAPFEADFEDREADGNFEVDEDLPPLPSDAEFEAMPVATRLLNYLVLWVRNWDVMSDVQREACAEDRRHVEDAIRAVVGARS